MKLLRPSEVKFPAERKIFRQSRLSGTIGTLVLGGIFLAAGPAWLLLGAPWFVWVPCLALGAPVGLFVLRFIHTFYRESNWVMAMTRKVLWINLRSHLNYHLPDGQTVVQLEVSEIGEASIYSEKQSTPNSEGGTTNRAMNSLQLKLTHTETQKLVEALEQERNRRPVPWKFRGSSRALHYPVSVPEPGMIRIAWRGSTMEDHVTPSADHAIDLLAAAGGRVEPSILIRRGDWSRLEGAELDSRVRELALAGDQIAAVELLRARRKLSLTEASRRLAELAGAEATPASDKAAGSQTMVRGKL